MKIKHKVVMAALLALLSAGSGMAATISGSLWHVSEATANAATIANVPATPADVTFSVNSPLNFDSRLGSSDYTVAGFLGTGGAFGIVEHTAGTLASTLDSANGGTLIDFKGFVTVTHNQTFTVTHDDGLTLVIGGLDLGFSSGPTSPATSTETYTGPSGNFPFELVYGECCGAPAVLQVDLPFSTTVPEATSTLALLSLSIVGLFAAARRVRAVAA
jgi:hypothetical protein